MYQHYGTALKYGLTLYHTNIIVTQHWYTVMINRIITKYSYVALLDSTVTQYHHTILLYSNYYAVLLYSISYNKGKLIELMLWVSNSYTQLETSRVDLNECQKEGRVTILIWFSSPSSLNFHNSLSTMCICVVFNGCFLTRVLLYSVGILHWYILELQSIGSDGFGSQVRAVLSWENQG